MKHNSFKKANKSAVYLKLAITGPSGSGKTTAALRLARGLVGDNGRIAVIDTENSSSLLYADTFDFDVCVVEPPYTEDKFITAITDAVENKYDCVIIDSFSHVWQAILDYKSKLDMRGGNSYTNWAAAGGKFENILQAVLSSKLHIICCMRSKMDYAIDIDEKGKKSIRKVGLAPIMRDGIEFEFSLVFDLDMNHKAVASKDRTRMFDGNISEITEETGKMLNSWRLGNTKNSSLPEAVAVAENSDDEIPMTFSSDLESVIGTHSQEANFALRSWGWIQPDETWKNLRPDQVSQILKRPNEFIAKAIESFANAQSEK